MAEIQHISHGTAFRYQTWRTKWLLFGGAFLALWYSVRFLDREWMSQLPVPLLLLVTGLAPHVFMLMFPILTRDEDNVWRIHMPGLKQTLIELAIAFPIVIMTMVALGGLNFLVGELFPGKTLRPDAISSMASASPRFVYPILLFSFTFAPVSEEVFFRGFIYNSFRRRMPLAVAIIIQSVIFGFCHFFGTTHAIIAVALGIVITIVYEWRKTLVTPILVHAGVNIMAAIGVLAMMAEYADRPVIGVIGGPEDTECFVREVMPNSAASVSGIMIGDQIVSIDGESVASFQELATEVSTRKPDDTVNLRLLRNGQTLDIEVTLKRRGQPP